MSSTFRWLKEYKIYILPSILFFVSYMLPSYNVKFLLLTVIYFSCFIFFFYKFAQNKFLLIFCFVLFCLFNLSVLINVNQPELAVLVYQLTYVGFTLVIGSFLYKNPELSYNISKFNIIFFILFLCVHYFLSKFDSNPFYIYANDIFFEQSRNSVSFYAIFSMIFYAFTSKQIDRKVNILYIIPLVVFCLLLFGRSGIALAIATLFVILSGGSFKRIFTFFIVLLCIIITQIDLINAFLMDTNFSRGLESPRNLINQEFLTALNLDTFIFGVNIFDVPTAFEYGGNPHNSFILVNFKFGFMVLFFVYLALQTAFILMFKDFFSFLLFSILLVRYELDTVAFFGQYTDLIFYIFVFHSLHKIKRRARSSA